MTYTIDITLHVCYSDVDRLETDHDIYKLLKVFHEDASGEVITRDNTTGKVITYYVEDGKLVSLHV